VKSSNEENPISRNAAVRAAIAFSKWRRAPAFDPSRRG
jgi:hypothetical protein